MRKFKKGDTVKVVNSNRYCYNKSGVVVDVDHIDDTCHVEMDHYKYWYHFEDLELFEESRELSRDKFIELLTKESSETPAERLQEIITAIGIEEDLEGVKHDAEKPRWDLVDWECLEGMVKVLTLGSKKYSDNNWKKIDRPRYEAALLRHWVDYKKGNKIDKESGESHLSHMMANLMFLIYKDIEGDK